MKVKIVKKKGLFKRFYAEVDFGYTFKDDWEELADSVISIFKEWDKETKKK